VGVLNSVAKGSTFHPEKTLKQVPILQFTSGSRKRTEWGQTDRQTFGTKEGTACLPASPEVLHTFTPFHV